MSEPLQDRYAEALAGRSRDRAGCPAPEELQRLADRTVNEPERLRLYDHVMACRECHREYALLASIEAGRPRRAAPRWLALAATLLLAVSAGLLWKALTPGQDPGLIRGDAASIDLLAPDADAVVPDSRFVWRAGAPGATYRFEVLQEGGVSRYAVLTTDTALVLPDSVSLVPGTDYTWWVQIVELGKTQAASAFRRFRITP